MNADDWARALTAGMDVTVRLAPAPADADPAQVVNVSIQYDDVLDSDTRYVLVEPAHTLHFTVATPSPELMRLLMGYPADATLGTAYDPDYDDRFLDRIDEDLALEREWQGRLRAEAQTRAWKHPQPRLDPTAILDEQ